MIGYIINAMYYYAMTGNLSHTKSKSCIFMKYMAQNIFLFTEFIISTWKIHLFDVGLKTLYWQMASTFQV